MSTDGFGDYLNEIGREALLRPDEEIELSRQIKRWLELRDMDGERTAAEKRDMKRGLRARERMIRCNLRMVIHVARKYRSRLKGPGMDMGDLVQEGTVGLARAAELYDGTKGYKFSTYAYWWIRQGITRALATQMRLIRIPQHHTDLINKAVQKQREYMQEYGHQPNIQDWAEMCDTDVDTLLLIMQRSMQHRSLHELATENGSPLIDLIPDESTLYDDYEHIVLGEQFEQLKLAFFRLTDDEKEAVSKRLGLGGGKQHTYADIAQQAGVSRERIRQRFEKAQTKMRLFVNHPASRESLAA
jgi:RNA polymerase sigma factor (sigma-70 family)